MNSKSSKSIPFDPDKFWDKKKDGLELIVFDLDHTLWPFWVETNVYPPFSKTPDGRVVDTKGIQYLPYPESTTVLQHLKKLGYKLGVASRTKKPSDARHLMSLYDWDKYVDYYEIYPGEKDQHFSEFRKKHSIRYEDMLFFDDEKRNCTLVSKLGVTCVWISDDNGVTKFQTQLGIETFANNQKEMSK